MHHTQKEDTPIKMFNVLTNISGLVKMNNNFTYSRSSIDGVL